MLKKIISLAISGLMLAPLAFGVEKLNGAGASFPYPVYAAWAYHYQKSEGARVNYQSIGSGGGVRQISSRTVDFGASDAPLKPEKLRKNNLMQFPAIIGGVVPVVNIKGVKQNINLTSDQLADIFMGKITKWNDPSIKANNSGLRLPSGKITVVHRSDGSGTTAIFTTYLSKVSKHWKEKVGKGKAVKWPAGIGGKGNEGVANYVKRIKNSIGYVEFAYAKKNRLTYAKLKNKAGVFAEPSFNAFAEAAAYAKWDSSKGYYLWLVDAPGKGSWPIAGASFILMAKENTKANEKVIKFYNWCFNNGDLTAKKLVYVPLPKNLKEDVRRYWVQNNLTVK